LKLAKATKITYTNHIIILFNWLKRKGIIKDHEFKRQSTPSKINKNIIDDASFNEILNFLKEKSEQQYRLIYFLKLTGFRRTEATELTKADINFRTDIIYVRNKINKNEIDQFPLYPTLKKFLNEFVPKLQPNAKIFNYSTDGLKFWNRAMQHLGYNYTLHDIRRTFGTLHANKGTNTLDLMKLMRHRKIDTTMKYYVNMNINRIGLIAERNLNENNT
jgi:integrase